jgi:outer membrane biogenesis lipoprotein LolB
MEPVMQNIKALVLILLVSLTVACSQEDDKNKKVSGDHVWKQQTDTIQASKDAAKKIQQSLDQEQQNLDKNK